MNKTFVPPDFDSTDTHAVEFAQNGNIASNNINKVESVAFYYQQDFDDKTPAGKQQKTDYSLFKSNEFIKENTLLTNIEDYAKKIRDSADKYKARICREAKITRSKIELELANTLLLKKEAEEKAHKLVAEAQAKHDEAVLDGQKKGYEAGLKEGLKKIDVKNQKVTARILAVLREIETLRSDLTLRYEKQIVELCLQVAQKITHRSIRSDIDLVLHMVKEVIQQFDGQGDVRIKVNPEEYKFIIKYQDEVKRFSDKSQAVKFQADNAVNLASAIIESDFSVVDLNINEQFLNLQKAIEENIDKRRVILEQ